MKRSPHVGLALVPVVAASAIAAGCGSRSQEAQGWQACVDRNNRVADERQCDEEQRLSHPVGYVPLYHWYYYRPYGGGYTSVPAIGQPVPPGGQVSTTRFSGASRSGTAATGVTRGGFGSTASGKAGQ